MVKIHIATNTRAILEGDYKPSAIDKLLRFHPEGYMWSPSFKSGNWDGWVRLFNRGREEFPAGCVSIVKDYFDSKHIPCEVVDHRVAPVVWNGEVVKELGDEKLGKITLRPDQRKIIKLALQATRGVVKSSVGSGKTEQMAGLVASLAFSPMLVGECLMLTESSVPVWPKTLIVVPNRNLVNETSKRLEMRLGVSIGCISHGKWDERDITVALPATLGAAKHKDKLTKLLRGVDVLLTDECQHNAAKTFYAIVNKCSAYYRFGFSATPMDRADGSNLRLIATTGPIIADVSSSTLVAQGVLAKPYVKIVPVDIPQLPDQGVPYADVYSLGVVRNGHFHDVLVAQVLAETKEHHKVLVLVTQIAHGHYIEKRLVNTGLRYRFLWANMPNADTDIELVKQEFKDGKLDVLIASPIFGEGTDIPNVDTVVIGDSGKSVIRTIQKVGRAMRKKMTGLNQCRIIDFAHSTHPYLARHSLQRIAVYKQEGYEFI